MAIQFTLPNIIQLSSALAPILLGFFMVMLSILNQNVKGIVYLGGVLIATVINIFIMNTIKSVTSENASPVCSIVELPYLTRFNSPNSSSVFIAFTFAYLFLPMRYNNMMNYPIIASLFALFAMDAVTKVTHFCTTPAGAVLGGLVGFLLGSAWYTVFNSSGAGNLLYFDEMESNAVVCKRPSKQTFKCSAYKNGKLVSSNIA
jgi:hypothetical protein